jgi:hypothetical protein
MRLVRNAMTVITAINSIRFLFTIDYVPSAPLWGMPVDGGCER